MFIIVSRVLMGEFLRNGSWLTVWIEMNDLTAIIIWDVASINSSALSHAWLILWCVCLRWTDYYPEKGKKRIIECFYHKIADCVHCNLFILVIIGERNNLSHFNGFITNFLNASHANKRQINFSFQRIIKNLTRGDWSLAIKRRWKSSI